MPKLRLISLIAEASDGLSGLPFGLGGPCSSIAQQSGKQVGDRCVEFTLTYSQNIPSLRSRNLSHGSITSNIVFTFAAP